MNWDRFHAANFCRAAQVLIVVIATLLHTVFLSKAKPLQSANDRSRWCTVWSLVEKNTFQIDEIRQRPGWDTIDLVYVDGHFYSTKPPLLTSVVAGITWCVQRLTGWNLIDQLQPLTFVVLLLVNLVPFVVSLLIWIAILERIAEQSWTRFFALVIAAFGTLLTPFLMTLNNHTVAAASTTVALYALLRILTHDRELRASWPFTLCGIAAAWAASNELPAAALMAFVFVVVYRRSVRKTLAFFLPAAAVPIVALIASNVIATGSWKPIYADYGTDKYQFVIDGVPSYWMRPQGVDRNLDSSGMYFIHCTFGHHGLFSLTPIALLAVAGWMMGFRVRGKMVGLEDSTHPTGLGWRNCFRVRDCALQTLVWLSAATSVIVLAFYMTRTQNYNYGGVSCGLRWALWLTPLWLVAIVPALDTCARSWPTRGVAVLLAMVSMYSAWQPIDNPWRQPWLFQWMESRGWIDYSEPPPVLTKPLWTWFATLPESVDGEPAWIEFAVAQPGLAPRFVRLTARPDSNGEPGERRLLEVRESWGDAGPPERVRRLLIDVREFNRGAPPGDFMRWSEPNITAAQQQTDLAFVRGLPRKVPYEARAMRYLKTSLRREALRCQFAAAHVSFANSAGEKPTNHRCDVWLSEDVPFGVAQVEFHISDPETAAILFHERWTVRDCWPKVFPYPKP